MLELTYYTLDVFTTTAFGGNQLAVIPEAPELEDNLMQAVAREFNYPETVFVRPVDNADALCRLRIFTPQSELPFAGHPTIGTAQLLVELGLTPQADGNTTEFLLKEGIGLVPVSVSRNSEDHYFTWLTVTRSPEAGSSAPSIEALAAMLGLKVKQIGSKAMNDPRTFSAGVPFTFIPLRDREALRECNLDLARWRESLAGTEAPQVYVFCRGQEGNGVDFHARMFAPGLGVPEDPATGAAAAAFAGYLWEHSAGAGQWTIAQGEDMGRPSTIHLEANAVGDRLQSVRVGGTATRVCHGTMRLP